MPQLYLSQKHTIRLGEVSQRQIEHVLPVRVVKQVIFGGLVQKQLWFAATLFSLDSNPLSHCLVIFLESFNTLLCATYPICWVRSDLSCFKQPTILLALCESCMQFLFRLVDVIVRGYRLIVVAFIETLHFQEVIKVKWHMGKLLPKRHHLF